MTEEIKYPKPVKSTEKRSVVDTGYIDAKDRAITLIIWTFEVDWVAPKHYGHTEKQTGWGRYAVQTHAGRGEKEYGAIPPNWQTFHATEEAAARYVADRVANACRAASKVRGARAAA